MTKNNFVTNTRSFLGQVINLIIIKTDSEIRAVLPNLRSQMLETNNIATLNEIADSYIIWSDILRENNDDVLAEYKTLLVKLLEDVVKSGKEEILAYSSDLFHMSSEKNYKYI